MGMSEGSIISAMSDCSREGKIETAHKFASAFGEKHRFRSAMDWLGIGLDRDTNQPALGDRRLGGGWIQMMG